MSDDEPNAEPATPVPVVGIGASAGGIEALTDLIAGIEPGVGACYVIIQHLAPNHRSILHELLDKHSSIPVSQIEDGELVRPDTIIVIPPGQTARIHGDHLELTARNDADPVFRPIDIFFSSLADARRRAAYCVILSGTGSDGTAGMRDIKSAGGVAIVQESEGARFPGMPDSAVATGLVDLVLPSREIGPRLRTILRHRSNHVERRRRDLAAEVEAALPRIARHLASVTGHDFSEYKPGTLTRRIERRMSLLRIDSVDRFVETLETQDEQASILTNDFLIGVTRFFRDPEVFAKLPEQVVDPILDRALANVRIWVPGCSTGEEAYSIAILFLEAMRARGDRRPLQVFGTDIDQHALLAARYGEFDARALEGMDPDRRGAFFLQSGNAWRARPELREVCVFAPHNLLQDPPFSRLDMISCRNMLIYLKSELQSQVFPRFHFSLRSGGMLLLGPSETLAGNDALFHPVDKSARIFLRNDEAAAGYSALSDMPPAAGIRGSYSGRGRGEVALTGAVAEISRETAAQHAYLKSRAAPFAVVSSGGEVLYVSPRMAAFVGPAPGVPTTDIDGYLAPALRVPVRIALGDAVQTSAAAIADTVIVPGGDGGGPRVFDIAVEPLPTDAGAFLISLTEVRAIEAGLLDTALDGRDASDRHHLEDENVRLRRQVTATLREYETSGQELKSSNEELMSMNEELQSSNEELETSREELQSINEELETVNAELRENNQQLLRANSDLKNLFEATDIAVLFLDRSFAVRSFTPSTAAIFSIRARDVGRPIFDLASRVDYPELKADAANVDSTLQPIEREVHLTGSGETFLLRMRPYRTVDDRIDGYVLSFVDITNRKTAEDALRRNERLLTRQYAELENLYDTTPVGLALIDRDLRYLRVNEMLARIDGQPMDRYVGRTIREVMPQIAPVVGPLYAQVFETGRPVLGYEITTVMDETGDVPRHFLADFYPVLIEGEVYATGICVREVTEQKRLMDEVAASELRMTRLFDASPVFIAITEGPDHVFTYSNPANEEMTGHRGLIGRPLVEVFPEFDIGPAASLYDKAYRSGERVTVPELPGPGDPDSAKPRDLWLSLTLEPNRNAEGETTGLTSFAYDITEQVEARKDIERQNDHQRLLLGELQHRVKNTLSTIRAISRMLLPGSDDLRTFHDRLSARLGALARTHDLLTDAHWTRLELAQIVRQEAKPYDGEGSQRVTVAGDTVILGSQRATSLGMAIHELMTNAAKHGALSNDEGTVSVETEVREGRVHVRWIEAGGPPIPPEDARSAGFGTFVLSRVLTSDLGADVEARWAPGGLRYDISFEDRMDA